MRPDVWLRDANSNRFGRSELARANTTEITESLSMLVHRLISPSNSGICDELTPLYSICN
jgi:hypothetical protein